MCLAYRVSKTNDVKRETFYLLYTYIYTLFYSNSVIVFGREKNRQKQTPVVVVLTSRIFNIILYINYNLYTSHIGVRTVHYYLLLLVITT